MTKKPRIAVVSPFLDKRHGTERCVVEQIEHLRVDFDFHVYAMEVRDLDLSNITWHRIPRIRGPHLLQYLWFVFANQMLRFWDRRLGDFQFDLVFSPGINCFDAEIIAVHIVFAEYVRLARADLALTLNRPSTWPWLIHRKISYKLFIILERIFYRRESVPLVVISHKMENDLAQSFRRTENLHLLYHGIDPVHMNPQTCQALRGSSRRNLGIPPNAFAILIVGNDWKKKGLYHLLEAVARLDDSDLWVLVRGRDDSSSCSDALRRFGLERRVRFLPSVPDVEVHYAAADLYAGPSIEDSFAIPPLEAMACGLPTIVSRQAGVSEIITHGENGLILEDPRDVQELSRLIETVQKDASLRQRLSKNAADHAKRYTWACNAQELKRIIDATIQVKSGRAEARDHGVAGQI